MGGMLDSVGTEASDGKNTCLNRDGLSRTELKASCAQTTNPSVMAAFCGKMSSNTNKTMI